MYQEQIDRILRMVDAFEMQLANPIAESQIIEIEEKYSIHLPESYKAYLTKIQNGNSFGETTNNYKEFKQTGPYYGIYSLQKSLAEVELWELDLTVDFPLTEDLDFGEQYGMEEDWDKHIYRYENDPKYRQKIEEVKRKYQNIKMVEGSIPICEYGCGTFFRLVITGQNAGEVWVDSGLMNDTGFYSLNVDILTFFENWLEKEVFMLLDCHTGVFPVLYPFLEFGENKRHKMVKSDDKWLKHRFS